MYSSGLVNPFSDGEKGKNILDFFLPVQHFYHFFRIFDMVLAPKGCEPTVNLRRYSPFELPEFEWPLVGSEPIVDGLALAGRGAINPGGFEHHGTFPHDHGVTVGGTRDGR